MKRIFLAGVLFWAAGAAVAERNAAAIATVASGAAVEARADWWGFDSTNATRCLQEAIDSGARRLFVPNMGTPWTVNPIRLAGNQEITLEPGVVIEAIRGGFTNTRDSLLSGTAVSNIVIRGSNAVLRMHKADYQDKAKYVPAEWRMGVALRSCENVQLIGLTILSSGGDGVYIGTTGKTPDYCKDIVIRDCLIDDQHRQGISVISVINLLIENCVIRNTRGTPPMAGIDFEPNARTERLFGIVVRNCRFENNPGGAVILCASPRPDCEPISFHLANCVAISNRFAGGFGAYPPMDKIDFTMTNCVERADGKETVYNDFWREWQNWRPLDAAQQAMADRAVRRWPVPLRPAEAAASEGGAGKIRPPLLRGRTSALVWVGEAGSEATFTVSLSRDYGSGMRVAVIGPAGLPAPLLKVDGREMAVLSKDGATETAPTNVLFRGAVGKTITFKAAEAGAYVLDLDPGPGWFTVESTERPVAWLAAAGPLKFFTRPGTYYFYVPAEAAEFVVKAAGQGGEKVKVSVFNAAGERVDWKDPVSLGVSFVVGRPKAAKGEVWSVQVEPTPGFYMEDYSLDLLGVPPLLAVDKRALLKP